MPVGTESVIPMAYLNEVNMTLCYLPGVYHELVYLLRASRGRREAVTFVENARDLYWIVW